ncbi:hypothetical protein CYMTET_54408 [Cymbomonas tetramitiformis]|uniref:Sfi1 spindle body domain-containing protein n=1 Tax=Cymbomonas tetramitiformis TaxID=36881 RepID=A0AAE0EPL6_9CHLO|nr:hypothetical protein CYMTET_54408 [Cymbomonas tetramitiformis]
MLDGNKYLEAIIETWNEAHKGTKLVLAHAVDRLEGTLELCESCAGARATSVTEINSAARAFPDHFERGAAASKRILKELLEEKTSRTSRPSFATTMEEDEDEDEGWAKAKAAQKELSILQSRMHTERLADQTLIAELTDECDKLKKMLGTSMKVQSHTRNAQEDEAAAMQRAIKRNKQAAKRLALKYSRRCMLTALISEWRSLAHDATFDAHQEHMRKAKEEERRLREELARLQKALTMASFAMGTQEESTFKRQIFMAWRLLVKEKRKFQTEKQHQLRRFFNKLYLRSYFHWKNYTISAAQTRIDILFRAKPEFAGKKMKRAFNIWKLHAHNRCVLRLHLAWMHPRSLNHCTTVVCSTGEAVRLATIELYGLLKDARQEKYHTFTLIEETLDALVRGLRDVLPATTDAPRAQLRQQLCTHARWLHDAWSALQHGGLAAEDATKWLEGGMMWRRQEVDWAPATSDGAPQEKAWVSKRHEMAGRSPWRWGSRRLPMGREGQIWDATQGVGPLITEAEDRKWVADKQWHEMDRVMHSGQVGEVCQWLVDELPLLLERVKGQGMGKRRNRAAIIQILQRKWPSGDGVSTRHWSSRSASEKQPSEEAPGSHGKQQSTQPGFSPPVSPSASRTALASDPSPSQGTPATPKSSRGAHPFSPLSRGGTPGRSHFDDLVVDIPQSKARMAHGQELPASHSHGHLFAHTNEPAATPSPSNMTPMSTRSMPHHPLGTRTASSPVTTPNSARATSMRTSFARPQSSSPKSPKNSGGGSPGARARTARHSGERGRHLTEEQKFAQFRAQQVNQWLQSKPVAHHTPGFNWDAKNGWNVGGTQVSIGKQDLVRHDGDVYHAPSKSALSQVMKKHDGLGRG